MLRPTVAAGSAPKPAANWILTELARHGNERKTAVAELGLPAAALAALIDLVEGGKVARQSAVRELLPRMLESGAAPAALVAELGLARIDDTDALEKAARKAIDANPRAVSDYRGGKKQAIGALMGAVMREFGGKANSQLVRSVLEEMLEDG